jgi:hypothetical protein
VRGLVTDASGNLWIRLEGPRVLLYHDGKFEDPYARFDLQDIIFTATVSDYEGRVILSGLGDRTFRYEDGRLETIVSAEQNSGNVISLAATRDQSIWLGTKSAAIASKSLLPASDGARFKFWLQSVRSNSRVLKQLLQSSKRGNRDGSGYAHFAF